MRDLDRILSRYDLRTLETAIDRRRSLEERRSSEIEAKRRDLEEQLRKLEEMGSGRSARSRSARRNGGGRRAAGRPSNGRRRGRRAGAKARAKSKVERKPNARRLNDISLAEALQQVMTAKKKPVHYKELTETVQKKGLYRTKSKNLLSTVAVTLKRDGRFRKVEPGMYALR